MAHAAVTIITPLVHADAGAGESALCMALNVSNHTLDATMQVFDSVGGPQSPVHTVPVLGPHEMIDLGYAAVQLHDNFATCTVTSAAGHKGDFLVTLCVLDRTTKNSCLSTVTVQ